MKQITLEQINDIAESINSMSGLVYKMLMEFHTLLLDKASFYDVEETMGQVLAIQLLAKDLDVIVTDEFLSVTDERH